MVRSQRLCSLVRSTPLLLMLGVGGVVTAMGISSPGLSLPSASGGSIHDSPKEVIDQVWQIVYRDYLDSTPSASGTLRISSRPRYSEITPGVFPT